MSLNADDFGDGEVVAETAPKGPLGLTLKVQLEPEDSHTLLDLAEAAGRSPTRLAAEILHEGLARRSRVATAPSRREKSV
jgi:hypothetical protein